MDLNVPVASRPRLAGASVCIPSVRSGSISAAINSIRRQTRDDWELIVVMQGQDDALQNLVLRAEKEDHRIRGLWIADRGVSRARNAGVRAASREVIAFIDDDCEAEPDWLEQVTKAFESDASVGVVAGSLVAPPRPRGRVARCPESIPRDFAFRPDQDGHDMPDGAEFVSASLAIRATRWNEFGPFDEQLGAGMSFRGGEDLDLLLRIVQAEVPIRFLPTAIVHHTSGTRFRVRAVIDLATSYASGQGAAAAKLTMERGAKDPWRRRMWDECLWNPLRKLRWHLIPARAVRLVAFDRSYRRCLRDFQLNIDRVLVPK